MSMYICCFIPLCRYDEAVTKYETAIETAGKGSAYEIQANARICHAHRMVR